MNLKKDENLFDILKKFENCLNEYKPELFIGHLQWDVRFSPVMQILFFKIFGLKVMMQFHENLETHAWRYILLKIYRLADSLIVLSRVFEKFFKNFGTRAYYVQNPIFIDEMKNFGGRNPKKNSKTILWVGNVLEHKNPFAALQILSEVKKRIENIKLKILGNIGDKELFVKMQNFISLNKLEDNVEFCGYHTNVSEFYESADMMLVTSPSEGFGLAIAESKFYELPLVCYKLDRNELLRDGKGYIAVEQGDFRGAARAIIKILTDTELRCRLSAEAKESIQPFLDYDVAGAWQRVFEDLENDVPISPHNPENEEIQKLFVNELWQRQTMINDLIQHINSLESKN